MLGDGAYDQHSALQAGVVRLAASRLEQAVRALPPAPLGRPLCLVDYGSATGKNAVAAMTHLGTLIAQHQRAVPLALSFCDQPDNDWKALASRLHDAFSGRDDVTFAMFPRSFYGRVLPDDCVDLGWSAIAVHWLSQKPNEPIDRLWPHSALGSRRAAFSARAQSDWSAFLEQRARELRVGGQLVVVAACSRSDGTSTADAYLDVPWEVIGELERSGDLMPDERSAMHVPTYFRSADEWKAPFADGALPLELVDYSEELLPDVLWDSYERSGDRDAFAAAWVGWLRAFSEPLLASALRPSRDAAQRRTLLDEIYRRTTAHIANEPERARIPWTLALLHAARR
jgi:hypothetical protein